MRHRILTVILGLCVLFGVILTLPGCSSNKENDETYAYIFFPSGKMLALGEVEEAWYESNGLWALQLTGLSTRHTARI